MEGLKYRYEFGAEQPRPPTDDAREAKLVQSKAVLAACWVALAATIVCNGLFESMRLGGVTSAEVSNEVFAWFAPAGYVFAIWGVIYAALVVWALSATVRSRKAQTVTNREAALFVASCALNIGWLAVFHFRMIELSLVLIIALWCALAALYLSFRRRGEPLWTRIPFSLYFGWLTVAVCANAAHLAARWMAVPSIVGEVSAIVLVVLLLVVSFVMARTQDDLVFPLVVLWAAVGVGVRLLPVDFAAATTMFALSAAGALAIYIPAMVTMFRARSRDAGAKPLAGE